MRGMRIFFTFIILSFKTYGAQVLYVDQEYKLSAIDVGEDAGIVKGTEVKILGKGKKIKAEGIVTSVGNYTSVVKLKKIKAFPKKGDEVIASTNSLLLDKAKIRIVTKKDLLSLPEAFNLAEHNLDVEKEKLKLELLNDYIKVLAAKPLPKIILQKIITKALQEGRIIQGKQVIDAIIDIAQLWIFFSFSDIAEKWYYMELLNEQRLKLEKTKAELFLRVAKHYLDYSNYAKTIAEKEKLLNDLRNLLKSYRIQEGIFDYLIKFLTAEIATREQEISQLNTKMQELLLNIKLLLNIDPKTKIAIPILKSDDIITYLKESIKFPSGGYELAIARLRQKLQAAKLLVAKLKIRPQMKFTIGYPSLGTGFMVAIPIEGKAALEAEGISLKQTLYKIEELENKYLLEVSQAKLKLHYLAKLKKRLIEWKQHYFASAKEIIKVEDEIDYLRSRDNFINEEIKLRKEKEETILKLISYGEEDKFAPAGRVSLIPNLKYLVTLLKEKNPEIKYLELEARKSFLFLLQARARNNSFKENYFRNEYALRLAELEARGYELICQLISSYLDYISGYLCYKNLRRKADIYLQEWEIKRGRIALRNYLKKKAYLQWLKASYQCLEKILSLELKLLELKASVYCLKDQKLFYQKLMKIEDSLLFNLPSLLKEFQFDSQIHERILALKLSLALDRVALAKKGWWIKGPIELYLAGWPFGRGKDARNWKRIPKNIELISPAGILIPSGLIYQTPIIGKKIIDLRIAKLGFEIVRIMAQMEKTKLEGRRWLVKKQLDWLRQRLPLYQKGREKIKKRIRKLEAELAILRASEEDVLAEKRLFLDSEIRYIQKFASRVKLKMEHNYWGQPSEIKELIEIKQLRDDIPRIKILEKEAKIIEERYRRAVKLNFSDLLTLGIRRIGIWFLFSLSPDIDLIRSRHFRSEIPLYFRKENLEANLEYYQLLARYQANEYRIENLKQRLSYLKSLLSRIKKNVALALVPHSHSTELEELIERLEEQLNNSEQEKIKIKFDLKYLLGIAPERDLEIKQVLNLEEISQALIAPKDLLANALLYSPHIDLARSRLKLAYQVAKWDKRWMGLRIGASFLLDIIASREYSYGLFLNLLDPEAANLRYYRRGDIQLAHVKLGAAKLELIRELLKDYMSIVSRKNIYNKLLNLRSDWEQLLSATINFYFSKEIGWEEGGGLKSVLDRIQNLGSDIAKEYEELLQYLARYQEYMRSFSKYQEEEISFASGGFLGLISPFWKRRSNLFQERIERIRKWKQLLLKRKLNRYRYERKKQICIEELEYYRELNRNAENIEYNIFINMEKFWEEELKYWQKIKSEIASYLGDVFEKELPGLINEFLDNWKPELEFYYSPFLPIGRKDIITALTNSLLFYLRNFRFNEFEIVLFFHYLPKITKIWQENTPSGKRKYLGDWWIRYSNTFNFLYKLAYFNPPDLKELGILIHYTLLAVKEHLHSFSYQRDCSEKILKKIALRITSDNPYLFKNLLNISSSEVSEYLKWQDAMVVEADRLLFAKFSPDEIESARRMLAKLQLPFWSYVIGNRLDEQTQLNIINWLIASGIEEKKWQETFQDMAKLSKIIYQLYPKPPLEDLLAIYDSVRLRYFAQENDREALQNEIIHVEKSYMIGILLHWLSKVKLEGYDLEKVKDIIKWANFIKNSVAFRRLFGNYRLTDPTHLFYAHNLIYWAKRMSELSGNEEEKKKKFFQLLTTIYWLKKQPEFQNIFKDIDFKQPYLYMHYQGIEIKSYLGDLTYWAQFMIVNNFSQDFMLRYLRNLNGCLRSKYFRQILEQIYKICGITIDLSLEKPTHEMEKEIFGIYANWALYFTLRAIANKEDIFKEIDKIYRIAYLAKEKGLNLTTDDLKYWWQHSRENGFNFSDLKLIFTAMAKLENLLKDCSKKLERMEPKHDEFLKQLKNKKMYQGEIQRLAEEIILKEALSYQQLLEEYSLGLYCEMTYLYYFAKYLDPEKLNKLISFVYQHGLSYHDIDWLLKLLRKWRTWEREITEAISGYPMHYFSDQEIMERIMEFAQESDWKKVDDAVEKLLTKLGTFLVTFYQEHGSLPSKYILWSTLSPYLVNGPSWKIKTLIKYGALSKRASDPRIINLDRRRNIARQLLYFSYSNFLLFPYDEEIYFSIEKLKDIEIEELLHKLKKLQEFWGHVLIYKLGTLADKILVKKIKDFNLRIFKPMFYLLNGRQKRIKSWLELRRRSLGQIKQLRPDIEINEQLKNPYQRKKLIEAINKIAKEKYDVNLSPFFIHSLLWRLREGYGIKEAIDVFYGIYNYLKNRYQKIANAPFAGEVHFIIVDLARRIYLTPLSKTDAEKIIELAVFMQSFGLISSDIRDNFNNAVAIYFSGLNKQELNIILETIKELKFNNLELGNDVWPHLFYLLLKEIGAEVKVPPVEIHDKKVELSLIEDVLKEIANVEEKKIAEYLYARLRQEGLCGHDLIYFSILAHYFKEKFMMKTREPIFAEMLKQRSAKRILLADFKKLSPIARVIWEIRRDKLLNARRNYLLLKEVDKL